MKRLFVSNKRTALRYIVLLWGMIGYCSNIFATLTYHPFSVSDSTQVYFSPGNLQYNALLGTHKCADGKIKKGIWRFSVELCGK